MTIGSAPPIGETFTTWGQMTLADREAWFAHMRTHWHPNLMAGYAALAYIDRPTTTTPQETQ